MSEPVDLDGIEARTKDADEAIAAGDMVLVQRGAAARLAREDVPALVAEVRALRAKVEAVEALFSGGPDTPCRTVWRASSFPWAEPIECVEVPLDDLRAALSPERVER